MPVLGTNSHYMPHLVIERRENRKAIVDAGGVGREDYLGVTFIDEPADLNAGFVVQVVLDLIYYPQLSYSDIQPGATFTVREGLRIVAHGVMLNRLDPTE